MKKLFVKDIVANSEISDLFLVKKKDLNKSKANKSYISLKLCDKTGEVDAKIWDNIEFIDTLFKQGDVIKIKRGTASLYQNKMQISISDLQKVDLDPSAMVDFLESSPFQPDEMLRDLKVYLKKIKNKHLKKLMSSFFEDEAFVCAFCVAPAAKSVHHAYLGGLLEHTLSVTKLITQISKNYPELNEEILIAGAALHDIGKISELSPDAGFEYTDSGRLIGHIVLGAIMLEKRIEKIKEFPARLADLLKHMILSHHGIYEWGSPKRPKTLEALILHYADDMDAKIMMVKNAINKDVGSAQSGWTGYSQLMERYFFKDESNFGDDEELLQLLKNDAEKKNKKEEQNQFSMF